MTKLHFEAPSDLSVGRVRVVGRAGVIRDWMATPDTRRFTEDVAPGYYSAEISPAGLAPQSVIFEVQPGTEDSVVLPAFSWLQANTSNVTFLDISDESEAIRALFAEAPRTDARELPKTIAAESFGILPSSDGLKMSPDLFDHSPNPVPSRDLPPPLSSPAATGQRISVGLSVESAANESYRPYAGQAALGLSEGRLQLTLDTPKLPAGRPAGRVRLSLAIERSRIERLLLPLYQGGVQVTISPSTLSELDAEVEVTPRDPRLRALARVLGAGASDEAKAIRPLLDDQTSDPWEALLSALLSFRFPDVFPALGATQAKRLVDLAPWAYDSHVVRARQRLYDTHSSEDQAVAARDALEMLKKAQTRGSPYFSYSNTLFAELIEALSGHFERVGSEREISNAAKIRRRWFREQPLQAGAGVSFSWLRRDPRLVKAGLLAPLRSVSGRLPSTSTNVIFQGRLTGDRIQIEAPEMQGSGSRFVKPSAGRSPHGSGPSDAPAQHRLPGPKDDPNLGRFGGASKSEGYTLAARFEDQEDEDWAAIIITVTAEPGLPVSAGGVVWFCLHPSFNPQWVRVMLINGRAELSIETWGGFTVGAWLPDGRVELELDLAKHPLAPQIVRRR